MYRGLLEASSRDAHAAANWFQLARAHAAEAGDLERLPRVWVESGLGFLAVGEADRALADTSAMWEGGIWSLPSQRGTVGWNHALALSFKGRFAQTYAMLRPEQRTANPLGRSFEAVIAALARDTRTWDALVTQGPPRVGFGVFARFAEDAWARHGDELRCAQAGEFPRRPEST